MSIPYFPLYVVDFEADTTHLTLAEDGCYNRLLRLCWRTPGCTIPNDKAWIMRRLRVSEEEYESVVSVVLSEFFRVSKGRLFSPRLMAEYEKTSATFKKRSSAGKKGGRPAKSLKNNEISERREKARRKPGESNQNQNQNQIKKDIPSGISKESEPDRFLEFWELYPHRGGAKKNRKQAAAAWKAARNRASQQTIIDGAERFRTDRRAADGYAPDPHRWLQRDAWGDEIEKQEASNGRANTPIERQAAADAQSTDRWLAVGARRRASSDGPPSHFDPGGAGVDRWPDQDASQPFLSAGVGRKG